MGTKSKFFRAFVEGQTISDSRKVDAAWIDQIVDTFSTENYTPRINVEHIAGFSPEPPFNAYGSVIAAEARTDNFTIDGKAQARKALYLQVDANDQLVQLSARDQKPFPSVELTDNYAGTNKVGLVGLAFTDTPASIGTQALKFSRHVPGSVFSIADERAAIEFEAAPADTSQAGLAATIGTAVAAAFARLGFKPAEPEKPKDTPPVPANDNVAMFSAMSEAMSAGIAAATAPIATQLAQLAGTVTTLQADLEKTEGSGFSRKPATGAQIDAAHATDC